MTSQRLRTWVAHLAVASLLLAQSLGLLHRVVHSAAAWGTFQGTSASKASPGAAGLAGLFAGHDRDTDCRLFDQLAHADLASPPVLALPCEFGTSPAPMAAPCAHRPAPLHAYCARGPPASA